MSRFTFNKAILIAAMAAFSLLGVITGTIAWFISTVTISNINGRGTTDSAYFAYGTGTVDDPFGISDTRHLNNLAWLQYNGTFDDNHYYFELANDINMDGSQYVIPPIGTEDHPFIGVFDGNGHTINNVKVTNDPASFSSKPTNISYTQADAEIVGFFGVVGKYDGSASYASSVNSLSDVTLKNVTVESKTAETLIGLAAGYVNADMSGVKVDGEVTLDVNDQEHTAKTSITDNISDYGLVGYSTKTGSGGSYSQKLSRFYSNGEGSGGGHGQDFGGSIDMLSLYNRLSKVYNEDSYDNGDFTVNTVTNVNGVTTKQKVENLDNHFAGLSADDYSYTFNKHISGDQDFYYLYGDYSPVSGTKLSIEYTESIKNVDFTQWKIRQAAEDMYYFSNSANNRFLKLPQFSSTNYLNLQNSNYVTSGSDYTIFYRTTVNSSLSTYKFYTIQTINGRKYYVYLYFNINGDKTRTLQARAYTALQTSSRTTWTLDSSQRLSQVYSNTTYYITYSSNYFQMAASSTNAAILKSTPGEANYLTISSDGNCSTTDVSNNATLFGFENNKIFTILDNKLYYLVYDNENSKVMAVYAIDETSATSWTFSNNNLSFQTSGNTYYLDFSSSGFKSSSQTTIYMDEMGTGSFNNVYYVSSYSKNSSSNSGSFSNTYIPLSVSSSNIYSTISRNTGYIISGKESATGSPESDRYREGDIRVSRYDMDNISTSLGQSTFDNSKLYAITATSNSDYSLITDTNNNGTNVPSGLSSITGRKTATSLNRYNDWSIAGGATNTGARVALGDVFTKDSSNIYGLHFMKASISESDVETIPNAKINGVTYASRKMPKDSIDFVVKDIGYITFFAGTYFSVGYDSVNTSFFSLHQISRNDAGEITDITEIKDIWKDNSNNYYYNPTNTTNLTKLFDTEVLTEPNKFINNAVYYFEIPVSAGEYALGSVSGKNGAYLMYLDISASGEQVLVDTVSAYSITTISTGNAYPVGVDFVPISVTGDGGETIAISIASGEQGSLIIAISTKDISVTDTSSIANYAYKSSNCVVSNPNDDQFICNLSGAPPTPSGGGVRILNIDLSKTNGDTYSIRITDILSDDSGTIDSSTFELDSGSGFVNSTQSAIEALSTEINLTNLRELEIAAILSRATGTGEFVTTYNTANCSDANKIVDVDIDLNGTTISVGVTANYTFRINGEPYADSSTYPAS